MNQLLRTPASIFLFALSMGAALAQTNLSLDAASQILPSAGNLETLVSATFGNGSNSSTAVPPVITSQPAGATVSVGGSVTFTVVATGTSPSYQWEFNGFPIKGATAASYSVVGAKLTDAGAYTVSAHNGGGNVTSTAATLSVVARSIVTSAPTSRTVNAGATVALVVAATGSGLSYQWSLNGNAIAGATSATYTLTNLAATEGGTYAVAVSDAAGVAAVEVAELIVTVNARITNLSIRGLVGTGLEQLVVGFQIGGSGTKSILVRAVGPTLSTFGVTGVLATPELTLSGANAKTLATNSGWGGGAALAQAFAAVGAFALPAASADAALLTPLASGGYTATVSGAGSTTGIALAEVYDADPGTPTATLVNISGRAYTSASNVLTAGFVIAGTTSETVLIRGIGPTLTSFGLSRTLPDTTITLYNSAGVAIATNTTWGNDPRVAGACTLVGAFALPPASRDSAALATIAPGAYTAQLTSPTGSTGLGMVEIYEVK